MADKVYEDGVYELGVYETVPPPSFIYNYAKAAFPIGIEDWDTLTYKATLVNSGYNPGPDDVYASAFSGSELSGGVGLSAGFAGGVRQILTGRSVVQNDTDDDILPNSWSCRVLHDG